MYHLNIHFRCSFLDYYIKLNYLYRLEGTCTDIILFIRVWRMTEKRTEFCL